MFGYIYCLILLLGLFSFFLLFKRFNQFPKTEASHPESQLFISIIIPARNEEKNLPNILNDLMKQTYSNLEIIGVDDQSTDGTKSILESFPIRIIPITEKPENWAGKTYACQRGAKIARGDVLLFLDADMRLNETIISEIAKQFLNDSVSVFSVQPFHVVKKWYEQFAFFFNVIGFAGNGAACPFIQQKAGLFGPVIAIRKSVFSKLGGFSKVKSSIIEDVELGTLLHQKGIPFTLALGKRSLSYRMYSNFSDLIQGFGKNFSSGAFRAPFLAQFLVFLWVTTITVIPFILLQALFTANIGIFLISSIFYLLIVRQLFSITSYFGSFNKLLLLIYPIQLLLFHCVFFYSLYRKIFKKSVRWKGRDFSIK